ncbi:hypothetical protein ACFLT1_06090 [Bacteroidota bacterium]
MKIESKIGKSATPVSKVYTFISDFRNFNNFIPADRISNWEADIDTCSFSINLLGKVGLEIIERESNELVKIQSQPEVTSYNFTLWMQFKEADANDTRIKITIEPQLNQVMLSMVKSPLKNFVDSLIDEIEKFDFSTQ